jgi:hypothetical protein
MILPNASADDNDTHARLAGGGVNVDLSVALRQI